MRKLLFLLFILILGCSPKTKKTDEQLIQEKIIRYLNAMYDNDLSLFDNKLIDHFPDKVDSTQINYYASYPPTAREVSCYLEKKITTNEYDNLMDHYSSVSKEILIPSDSLLVINRFDGMGKLSNYKLTDLERKIIEASSSYSLPVPNFWRSQFSSDKTPCHLSNSFKLYIIDAKKGKYLADSCLTKGEHMPSDWKNGFSKGIAISKDSLAAIYWIVVW